MRTRHHPVRTCLGCGEKKAKGKLVRVGIKGARLAVDESGRFPGRGAYLCRHIGCISRLLKKKGRLCYALRISLPRAEEEGFLWALLRAIEGED